MLTEVKCTESQGEFTGLITVFFYSVINDTRKPKINAQHYGSVRDKTKHKKSIFIRIFFDCVLCSNQG